MSSSGEETSNEVLGTLDTPQGVVAPKADPTSSQAPSVPGHQEVVDAVWPILMREVEGMYTRPIYR